jgi:hypothetical protein
MNMIKKMACVAACLAASTCWAGFTVHNATASTLAISEGAVLPSSSIPAGASQDVSHGIKWDTIFLMTGGTLTVTFNQACSVVLVKSKTDQAADVQSKNGCSALAFSDNSGSVREGSTLPDGDTLTVASA